MTNKHDIAQQIVDLETLLEVAKDNWLEGKKEDAVKLLRQAKNEIGKVIWQAVPIKEKNIENGKTNVQSFVIKPE